MKTIAEIRRANLLILIKEAGTAARLSLLTDIPSAYISQVKRAVAHSAGSKRPRTIGNDLARKFEQKLGKPSGWMDMDHSVLQVSSDLTGREGQLIGMFRLMSEREQIALVDHLTTELRSQRHAAQPGSDSKHTH